MSRDFVFSWHKRFKDGRVKVRDDKCRRSGDIRTLELGEKLHNALDEDLHFFNKDNKHTVWS